MICFDFRYNLHQVVSILEEEDENFTSADIFIQPPENSQLSDEDSGGEEQFNISDLPGSLLRAEAEAHLNNPGQTSRSLSSYQCDDDDFGTVSIYSLCCFLFHKEYSYKKYILPFQAEMDSEPSTSSRGKRRKVAKEQWRKKDLIQTENENSNSNFELPNFLNQDWSPTSLFEFFSIMQ